MVTFSCQLSRVGESADVRWYYLLGGVCGAIWITTSLIAVKSLGAGGVVAATITGRLTGAVIADRLGVLGSPRPRSPPRGSSGRPADRRHLSGRALSRGAV